MKIVSTVDEAINPSILKPGKVIYTSGNAATPQVLLGQIAKDKSIKGVSIYGVLLLGESLRPLFSEERCRDITHRVIFASYLTREAVNNGWAFYHPMHLSEIPKFMKLRMKPNVAVVSVSGPDIGGRYSLGTTVEGVLSAVEYCNANGGIVVAERNKQMPFVLGTTIPEESIDYLVEADYPLPTSPTKQADAVATRIGEIIAALYVEDGSRDKPGSTLQYGIGEVPEAVTTAILEKGVRDLGIHTELFSGALARLVKAGVVSNRWKKHLNFAVSSIFLAEDQAGYDWLAYNSAVQSRPSNYTNSVFKIAEHPKMVSINSAIGVDLHGNIWADSLDARKIYSGVGGQSDFIRGAQYSDGGLAIIALKSITKDGVSKIIDRSPAGITTTAIPADQVILVTENGAFDRRGLSLGERAIGIAHLAQPEHRDQLLKTIADDPAFHKPAYSVTRGIPGFTPYEEAVKHL